MTESEAEYTSQHAAGEEFTEGTPARRGASQLAEAMLLVQANLPKVEKTNTATVKSEKGQFTYDYADLPDVSDALLPLLNEHGLVFMAQPEVQGSEFVLAWELLHVSGEHRTGAFPIPKTTPQQMGSAITYARRYTLCSVTGLAPDEDDDGAAASARPPARQGNGQQRAQSQPPAQQRTPGQNACAEVAQKLGLTPQQVFDWYQRRFNAPFGQATEDQLFEHASFMEDNPAGSTPAGDYNNEPPF